MKRIFIISTLLIITSLSAQSQIQSEKTLGYRVPVCLYDDEYIADLRLPTLYVFKPKVFKTRRQRRRYNRLIRDVRKTLPIAREINSIIIETYEFMMTLPKNQRKAHMKKVEKDLKKQYTPRMKKLTFRQGKLLIKLVYRETNSSSYQLVKAFLGPLRAGFYQMFASIFGASLKKEYDPKGKDREIEKIVLMLDSGQI